jgi:DeoR/GlpR family transcriptional regulator of sugar metabolism
MNHRERIRRILAALENGEELTVAQACRRFKASAATIRRDFQRLHAEGRVDKTWGGVKIRGRSFNLMPPYPVRESRQTAAKKEIALRAAALVQEGDVIFIDGGTTTSHLTPHLALKRIRIITNSLVIAHDTDRLRKDRPGAEVYLTGGMLFPQSELLVGPQARETLRHYHAQWVFLSAAGMDEQGASNHEERIVEIERAMIEQAERIALLADQSKCGIRSMVHVCSWDEVDVWVTDKAAGHACQVAAEKAGVRIIA